MTETWPFGRLLEEAAQAAVAFRRTIGKRLHRPAQSYLEVLRAFEDVTPEAGTSADAVLGELLARSEAGLHATVGPRFFGWVMGGSHPLGVAADWLASAWGQNAGNHTASPAGAAAETVSARWLLDILRLPPEASVGFVTGATMANFVCLAAARGEVLLKAGWDVEAQGLFGAPHIDVLVGDEAHSTVHSALQYLGFGRRQVQRIGTDRQGAMRPASFAQALARCSGPIIAITQAGQINTGALDPHSDLIALARERGAWVHVDGAFGLWARACPERAHLGAGAEHADSWATDGHKWLQTPYDTGFAIVRSADAHRRAMTIAASYLPPVREGERDPSHYVPELSRRGRGFATWAMLRHLGREGVAATVERHCRLCRQMADELGAEPGVEVMNEVVLNQAVVRFGADRPDDESDRLTRRVIEGVQADGTCFVGGASWRGRWVMRLSVVNHSTSEADARQSVEAIKRVWRSLPAATT